MAKESIKSFVHIFDCMEDIWLHVVNRMDQKFVRVCQNIV